MHSTLITQSNTFAFTSDHIRKVFVISLINCFVIERVMFSQKKNQEKLFFILLLSKKIVSFQLFSLKKKSFSLLRSPNGALV